MRPIRLSAFLACTGILLFAAQALVVAHAHEAGSTESAMVRSSAAAPDKWRTETCHLRGCQSLVDSLLRFIEQTYQFYYSHNISFSTAAFPLPEVHFISREALMKKACPSAHCGAVGWFPNEGSTVYMANDQNVMNDLYARGILVHELVHYVQHVTGFPVLDNACLTWKAREMQAYGIQYHWLRQHQVRVRTPAYNLRLANYNRMNCDGREQVDQ